MPISRNLKIAALSLAAFLQTAPAAPDFSMTGYATVSGEGYATTTGGAAMPLT